MLSIEYRKGITEVLDILEHMDFEYTNKISKDFLNYLKKNQLNDYNPNLNHNKNLNEMNLRKETVEILAIIYSHFWCNQLQKENYIKVIKENERQYKINKKHNYSNS